ncbi:MAG: hypothetical protein V4671_13940 [Armatimonadota bacterium]
MQKSHNEEFAEAAGLRPTDMPSSHHPLAEDFDEVETLGDLVDARENVSQDSVRALELTGGGNRDIDVEEALTFPHKHRATVDELVPTVNGFSGDARSKSAPDDADDASYMTRDDLADSMGETDPDPNTGMDPDREFVARSYEADRAPDITGTVDGVVRGTSTHVPLDLGADGFQIEDPDAASDPRLLEDDDEGSTLDNEFSSNDPTPGQENLTVGDVIPTRNPDVDNRDEALDATRRIV